MAGWNRIRSGLLAALLGCVGAQADAQTPGVQGPGGQTPGVQAAAAGSGGVLSGKLTDLRSMPLNRAAVVVRNEQTGAEAHGVTAKNGSFRFAGLEPGAYTVEAESGLGRGRLEDVVVAAGHEAHVQAAMAFEPVATAPTVEATVTSSVAMVPKAARESSRIAEAAEPVTAEFALGRSSATEMPTTETLAVTADLEVEAMRKLALVGEPFPRRVAEMPAVETMPVLAPLADEPLESLNLGVGLASPAIGAGLTIGAALSSPSGPTSSTGSVALSVAAASAVQAALAGAQADLKPAQTSSTPVDPVTEAVATAISASEIQALPAAGRRWQDFQLDTPAASTAADRAQSTSLRGSGQEPAETTIDGVSTRTAFGGQQSSGPGSDGVGGSEQNGMGQAWAGGRGSPVAGAAIREVQTAAGNAEAEGDRTAGGQVNVETARGTNGLHGQGFWFDRQNTWGAQNPFTQWVKETAPATVDAPPVFTGVPYTPPDHETVWGLGVGSQIRRDKLFWFGALDSYRRNDPGLATVKNPEEFFAQPSNDQMQVLSARLGLSSANPVAEGLSAHSQMLSTLDGLLGPAARTAAQWVGFGRLDWQAAERHRLTLEGTGAEWNSPGGGLTRVSETYGANSFGASQASEGLLLGRWEAFITPNLLAVTQGSFGRTIQSAHAETPSPFEQTFLAPSVWGQLPQMVVDSRYGFTIGNPSRFGPGSYPDEHVYQGAETMNWVRGSLLIKGGFEMSYNADATSLLRNETGTYHYASVENFASDALVFAKYGLAGELNPYDQHNCDQTGKVWRDADGQLRGLGYLPCYSYYSQVIGPTNWNLSTNDLAGFATAQWQPTKLLVMSGGLRWEREQLPPPIAAVMNADLPLTEKLPSLGNDFGPRFSLALGSLESHWPVLRLGYGLYFGRTENATIETVLTQTGSPKGDQSFFMRPTDNLNAGGAPPFPYVLSGAPASVLKPGAVEFAAKFRNPEVHQAVVAVEEELPGHLEVTASGLVSLGRRLPISIDTNFDPAVNPGTITYAVVNCPEVFPDATVTCGGSGPIKTPSITVPFYASWPAANSPTGFAGRLNPSYQQISEVMSRSNSTYEAAVLKIVRYGRRGLSLHAHYTYAHAMDWNPNESTTVAGSDVLDPADFSQEYGTSDLDVRHSAAVLAVLEAPWKVHGAARWAANGWMVSGVGQFRGGLPYTMRTAGSLGEEIDAAGTAIVALGPGMNGSGGDNRVYGVGRNTFRYPAAWKADLRAGKRFDLGRMRELEVLVESFNLFNHQNVTEVETTGYYLDSGTSSRPPTLNYLNTFTTQPVLSGLQPRSAFGQPLNVNATNFYRERQIQVGVRMRF